MKPERDYCLQIVLVLLFIFILFTVTYPIFHERPDIVRNNIDHKTRFLHFLERFNKSYPANKTEFNKRFEIFKNALSFIKTANDRKKYGENVRFGLTKFSDLSDYEFRNEYLTDNNVKSTRYGHESAKKLTKMDIANNLPLKVDWRDKGIISGIRNQGKCGSCYAQSVIGTIESSVTLNYNLSKPLELSVQQMVDCAGNFNRGCLGGDTCDLLEWLKINKIHVLPKELYRDAVISESQYCKNVTVSEYVKTAKVIRYTCLDFTGNEYEILNILKHKGPLAASVNGLLWKNYLGGIIKYHCNGPSNHAIEIVGYDLSPPNPHYIVRNSWGVEFGNDGYAQIAFGTNVCNIASEVSMVLVEWD